MIEFLSNAVVLVVIGALAGGLAKPAMADLWAVLKKDWRLTVAVMCFLASIALPQYVAYLLDGATEVTKSQLQLVLSTSVAVTTLNSLAVVLVVLGVVRALRMVVDHVVPASKPTTSADAGSADRERQT